MESRFARFVVAANDPAYLRSAAGVRTTALGLVGFCAATIVCATSVIAFVAAVEHAPFSSLAWSLHGLMAAALSMMFLGSFVMTACLRVQLATPPVARLRANARASFALRRTVLAATQWVFVALFVGGLGFFAWSCFVAIDLEQRLILLAYSLYGALEIFTVLPLMREIARRDESIVNTLESPSGTV